MDKYIAGNKEAWEEAFDIAENQVAFVNQKAKELKRVKNCMIRSISLGARWKYTESLI